MANKPYIIPLQPKQAQALGIIANGPEPVVGIGGGRGSAKSSGGDRIVLTLMQQRPGLLCAVVMRNWDQVYKYHIEPISRDFPELCGNLKKSMPASLKLGKSQCDFSYAENLDDIERRFRGGNYDLLVIDQAEQFTGDEIREMRKAVRSKGGGVGKIILIFNMRGAGIQDLRKWFYLHEVNKDEDPNDYIFLKFNPWDNIEWVRSSLLEQGYTESDYYHWTDAQRKAYAAANGPYTRTLATDDEVIRKADWEGSWDSLEGTFFSNTFDLQKTRITSELTQSLMKPWAIHWLGQDWGKGHYTATYWNYRVTLAPMEALQWLGWTNLTKPINLVVTYKEMIVNGPPDKKLTSGDMSRDVESTDVGRLIVAETPENLRKRIKSFFLSPDAFGVRDSVNTIAIQQGRELKAAGMPYPVRADNDPKGGWALMAKLLKATKFRGIDPETKQQYDDAWLISSECPELLRAIPVLMRDPRNLEVVLKTDKGAAKIEMDVADAIRYALKSMLAPRKQSGDEAFQAQMEVSTPAQRTMLAFKKQRQQSRPVKRIFQKSPPSWKRNVS